MPWNRIYMGNFWVQIFTELSRKSQDYISRKRGFHIKLMGPKSHWIPRKSSQNVKYWQNLTDLRYQAVKFHRLSSSRNLTGQKSHRRAWGEFSLECILYSPFLLTITFFSHDDFHWIQGSRDVFDFPSLSGKPRNSRNSVFYNAWPLYPLETGLLSIRK